MIYNKTLHTGYVNSIASVEYRIIYLTRFHRARGSFISKRSCDYAIAGCSGRRTYFAHWTLLSKWLAKWSYALRRYQMLITAQPAPLTRALQKHHTPVGDLYAATRHGRMKRCFTGLPRSAGWPTFDIALFHTVRLKAAPHPDFLVEQDHGEQVWRRGETTDAYHRAHQRNLIRRLRLIPGP